MEGTPAVAVARALRSAVASRSESQQIEALDLVADCGSDDPSDNAVAARQLREAGVIPALVKLVANTMCPLRVRIRACDALGWVGTRDEASQYEVRRHSGLSALVRLMQNPDRHVVRCAQPPSPSVYADTFDSRQVLNGRWLNADAHAPPSFSVAEDGGRARCLTLQPPV